MRDSRYQTIARVLLDEITGGAHPVGGRLPTENELAARFAVSRHTVRDAIRQLKSLGIVSQRPGAGTLVEARTAVAGYVQSPDSIDAMRHFSADARLVVDSTAVIAADAALAGRLHCKVGERWLRVTGTRVPDGFGAPIAWTEIFLDAAYAALAPEIGRHRMATYRLVEDRFGETVTEIGQEITACAISAAVARALGVPPRSPGLLVTRRYAGRLRPRMQATFSIHPAGRFAFSMKLKLDDAVSAAPARARRRAG